MDFSQVLKDIEALIGVELKSLNPNTGLITIIKLDYDHGNYEIKPEKGRSKTRSFAELEKIWGRLFIERAVSVESVLEGGGSSRHQPETILANLPYIDFFKYKKRKHLYLQEEPTHELATTNELTGTKLRQVRRVLDNQDKFDRHSFSVRYRNAISSLEKSIEEISIKYPGELQSSYLSEALTELDQLKKVIAGTVLPNMHTILSHVELDSMDDLDSAEFTGYDDPSTYDSNNEPIDEADRPHELVDDNKELSSTRIRHVTPTFSLVYDRMKHGEIELQPAFQRRDRIWKSKDKSALVESILIGLPIPNLYFAERRNGDWVIIDGLQRLTTLKDFMSLEFKLNNLSILKELNGRSFEELDRHHQRRFREYTLYCHVIAMKNDGDFMVKELFQRINTYGLSLSYQEIRCALYAGSSVDFIRYIAESQPFKENTFDKINHARMKDMELILGAVAFILFGYESYNYKSFDEFLGKAMGALNKHKINIQGRFITSQEGEEDELIPPIWREEGTADIFIALREKIERAFYAAEEVFGEERYQKSLEGRTVISKPLFELIVTTFAHLTNKQIETLISKSKQVRSEFQKLLNGNRSPDHEWESETYKNEERDFMYAISQSTGKRTTVLYRFQNFRSLIEDIIGEPILIKGLLKSDDK